MGLVGSGDINRVIQERQFGISSLKIGMRNEHEIVRLSKNARIAHDTDNLDRDAEPGPGAGAGMYSKGITHFFIVLVSQVLIDNNLIMGKQV